MSERETPAKRQATRRPFWQNRELVAIAVLYSAAWGLMLLNGGRYWDDWCMFRLPLSSVLQLGSMMGQVWQPYYWFALSWWPNVDYLAHALIFLSYLVTALALNRIMTRMPGMDRRTRVIVPALFAVFPVNAARMALVDFQYAISLALFFVAWYLVAVDLDDPNLVRRLSTIPFFVGAMLTTNSLMVFVVLVPLYVCWVQREELRSMSGALGLARRYGYLLLLPVVTWAMRSAFLQPWGLYADYNKVKWVEAYWNLGMWPQAFGASIIAPMLRFSWLAIPFALAAYWLLRRIHTEMRISAKSYAGMAVFGFAAFFVGAAPYLAVGKLPSSANVEGWDSRHQLLIPLGAALMVYGLVMVVLVLLRSRPWVSTAVFSILIGLFIASSVSTCVSYQVDWYKQLALISHMKTTPEFRAGNVFLFVDKATKYNADNRSVLPYEFNGMMEEVFGDASRFGSQRDMVFGWAPQFEKYLPYKQYHYWQIKPPTKGYTVTITPGTLDPTRPGTLMGLMFAEHFAPKRFQQQVGKMIELTAVRTK